MQARLSSGVTALQAGVLIAHHSNRVALSAAPRSLQCRTVRFGVVRAITDSIKTDSWKVAGPKAYNQSE